MIYIASRRRFAEQAPRLGDILPSVTFVVPALNEEETIESAMRLLMALDYPDYEVVAVDDRSTDRTGEILDRLADEYPGRLRVLHVEELPSGWLGKCHALDLGARNARGEWLVFTDADVKLESGALRTAMGYALRGGLDHVTLFPRMLWHDPFEAALLTFFAMSLEIGFKSWQVESDARDAYIGIGAFNLIRESLYRSFGGHYALRMEVADDMKLAYLAKKHGGRSMAVRSGGQVQVHWRKGVFDTVRGLQRSAFPGVGFDWLQVIAATIFFTLVMLAPYVLPFLSDSITVLIPSLVSIAVIIWAYALEAQDQKIPVWIGVLHPIACILFVYSILASAIAITARGGVTWRGTFYPIEELKRGTVR
jgi:cellulose synthase/poly-beta-1,6-N-acetylglucosamine synthase-like glycosyltransferase